jgi:hypothetical protein
MQNENCLTDEEIRQRYLQDLQDCLAKDRIEYYNDLVCAEEEKLEPTWLETIYNLCILNWKCANHAQFTYPDHYALTSKELKFFESSKMCWTSSSVSVEVVNGRRIIDVILVDWAWAAKVKI